MVNRTISLSEEISNKLKQEQNASGLIEMLLREHYKFNISNIEEINSKINEEKELIRQKQEIVDKQIEKFNRIKFEMEQREKDRASEEVEKLNKEIDFKARFFKNFDDMMKRYPTEEEFLDFKTRWDKKEVNFFEFIEEKGYKKEGT